MRTACGKLLKKQLNFKQTAILALSPYTKSVNCETIPRQSSGASSVTCQSQVWAIDNSSETVLTSSTDALGWISLVWWLEYKSPP